MTFQVISKLATREALFRIAGWKAIKEKISVIHFYLEEQTRDLRGYFWKVVDYLRGIERVMSRIPASNPALHKEL